MPLRSDNAALELVAELVKNRIINRLRQDRGVAWAVMSTWNSPGMQSMVASMNETDLGIMMFMVLNSVDGPRSLEACASLVNIIRCDINARGGDVEEFLDAYQDGE